MEQPIRETARSRAIERILHLRRLRLLAEDEFSRFSEETRRTVAEILDISQR